LIKKKKISKKRGKTEEDKKESGGRPNKFKKNICFVVPPARRYCEEKGFSEGKKKCPERGKKEFFRITAGEQHSPQLWERGRAEGIKKVAEVGCGGVDPATEKKRTYILSTSF